VLSTREREVVEHVVEGRSNDGIAARMGIGTRAVEAQLTRLYQRFAVQTRAELAVRAVREGWLDPPGSG
jgi:two-component system competent response regulator ComA